MSVEAVIDPKTYDELVEAVGSDFIGELVATYLEETPTLLAQLRAAWEQRDARVFERSAHSIKSSSASLGALAVAAQARELEYLGKQGQLDGCEDALAALETGYSQAAQALKERAL